MRDPEVALETHAREELGLDPKELGSPWGAAVSSFATFSVGALIPLVPFLVGSGVAAKLTAVGVSAAALFGVGAAISLLTGRHPWWSGIRMTLGGGLAAAVTYAVGRAFHITAS
jgi:VIT1/CCC1 family predicted Fe2+/Mn2+ transporter